jgi:transcriptional accessory protein Tex/SPT6
MQPEKKFCLNCQKIIQGRSDKKFCDDFCRNNFNNQLKSTSNNYIRNINNALKKNRNILDTILSEKEATAKTTRQHLLNHGFQFKYSTHSYTNKKGNTYAFCYDYGYLELEEDCFLVVRIKDFNRG